MKVKSNKQRTCPFCGEEELYYIEVHFEGKMCCFPWKCLECGHKGEEWYFMEFLGHNVIDENGNNVEIEDEMIEKEKDMLYCCIWGIEDIKNTNKIIVDLDISDSETILGNYYLKLDLDKMGLKKDDEFEDELHKDIEKFVNDYYDNYKRIPTVEEIKNKFEVNWLETKMWFEK